MPDGERDSQRLNYAQLAEDERARAERAREAREVMRLQAAVITGLQAELAERRLSKQVARDEAGDLRQRLAAMMARGWWARLRNRS
jgi:hypothetical protein